MVESIALASKQQKGKVVITKKITAKKSEIYKYIAKDKADEILKVQKEMRSILAEMKNTYRIKFAEEFEKFNGKSFEEVVKDFKTVSNKTLGMIEKVLESDINGISQPTKSFDINFFERLVSNDIEYSLRNIDIRQPLTDTSYSRNKSVSKMIWLKELIDKYNDLFYSIEQVENLYTSLLAIAKSSKTGALALENLSAVDYKISLNDINAVIEVKEKNELINIDKTKELVNRLINKG